MKERNYILMVAIVAVVAIVALVISTGSPQKTSQTNTVGDGCAANGNTQQTPTGFSSELTVNCGSQTDNYNIITELN